MCLEVCCLAGAAAVVDSFAAAAPVHYRCSGCTWWVGTQGSHRHGMAYWSDNLTECRDIGMETERCIGRGVHVGMCLLATDVHGLEELQAGRTAVPKCGVRCTVMCYYVWLVPRGDVQCCASTASVGCGCVAHFAQGEAPWGVGAGSALTVGVLTVTA